MYDREFSNLVDSELAEAEQLFESSKRRLLSGVSDRAVHATRRRFLKLYENLLSDMHEARRLANDSKPRPAARLLQAMLHRSARDPNEQS